MKSDNDSSTNNPQAASDDVFALLSDAERRKIWDRLLKEPARGRGGKAPAEPLSDFDRTFQEAVPPRLEGYIRLGAYMVSRELESFSEAHDRVMRVARKYGAMHLTDGAFYALDSWIDQQILACIDDPPPEGVIPVERLRAITEEPRR